MANSNDFTYGHDRDDALNAISEASPELDFDDPAGMVAGVILLDEHYKLRLPGDYVLVQPSLAGWLLFCVTLVDDGIRRMFEEANRREGDEAAGGDNAQASQLDERLVKEPFEIRFSSPEGEENDGMFPASVRGKTVKVRVMNLAEAQNFTFVHTVRADGTLIQLPGPGIGNVHELDDDSL